MADAFGKYFKEVSEGSLLLCAVYQPVRSTSYFVSNRVQLSRMAKGLGKYIERSEQHSAKSQSVCRES